MPQNSRLRTSYNYDLLLDYKFRVLCFSRHATKSKLPFSSLLSNVLLMKAISRLALGLVVMDPGHVGVVGGLGLAAVHQLLQGLGNSQQTGMHRKLLLCLCVWEGWNK